MPIKPDKQFLFETQLNWVTGTKGVLSARKTDGVIQVATPPAFGGEGRNWSPEQLFLGSVGSGFMTTYLAFAAKLDLDITHFECNAIGLIRIIGGKYRFTQIDLWPKIFIADEPVRNKANQALEKTHKYSLITNSVNADVFFHSVVLVEPPPANLMNIASIHDEPVSLDDAREIGEHLGIDFKKYSLTEFRKGLEVEMEHGRKHSDTNITDDNKYLTGKIAWAHLREISDYYTRLEMMEKTAQQVAGNNR